MERLKLDSSATICILRSWKTPLTFLRSSTWLRTPYWTERIGWVGIMVRLFKFISSVRTCSENLSSSTIWWNSMKLASTGRSILKTSTTPMLSRFILAWLIFWATLNRIIWTQASHKESSNGTNHLVIHSLKTLLLRRVDSYQMLNQTMLQPSLNLNRKSTPMWFQEGTGISTCSGKTDLLISYNSVISWVNQFSTYTSRNIFSASSTFLLSSVVLESLSQLLVWSSSFRSSPQFTEPTEKYWVYLEALHLCR